MAQARDLLRAVNAVLERHWDPIGVYGPPPLGGSWPPGEYEHYAAQVLAMLQRGETAAAISGYLAEQAREAMGVEPGPARAVAERLHHWWHVGRGTPP